MVVCGQPKVESQVGRKGKENPVEKQVGFHPVFLSVVIGKHGVAVDKVENPIDSIIGYHRNRFGESTLEL